MNWHGVRDLGAMWYIISTEVFPLVSTSSPDRKLEKFPPEHSKKKKEAKTGDDRGKTITVVKTHAYIPCTTDLKR